MVKKERKMHDDEMDDYWRRAVLLTGWIVGEYGASLIGLSVLVKSEGGA